MSYSDTKKEIVENSENLSLTTSIKTKLLIKKLNRIKIKYLTIILKLSEDYLLIYNH